LTLLIAAKHVERISSHSKESHPIEACGVLIGTIGDDVRTVTEVWPAKNRLSSESSYEIDPETLFLAFSYAEKNNLEVIGFYHSHPFWSADASEIDRARANYPGLSYVIYSVPRNEILSFYFDGKQLAQESAIVSDSVQTR
jgi:proteasome lid subunit RPN8/RPN11